MAKKLNLNLEDIRTHIRAQEDYLFFLTDILGYQKNEEFEYHDLTPIHKKLCKVIEETKKRFILVLMPRYSFKSGVVTVGHGLWSLVKNSKTRILIYSDSAMKAEGFLQGIKNHILGTAPNSKFRKYYPRWETDAHKGLWNNSQILISSRKQALLEPSVDTGGIESSKIGMHYDWIYFDDIVSDLNTTTKFQMDKVYDCFKKSLSLLTPKGKVVVIGTRWHYGDAYAKIIEENKILNDFEIFVIDAEEKNEDGTLVFESIGLDRKFLDYQRIKQGSYLYSCLYRNSPVDNETALFKVTNFRFYKPEKDFHKELFITGALDPAGEGEDFSAITIVGTNNHKQMYVLDAVNDHLSPSQLIFQVIRLNYKWGFNKFIIEKNFFKGLFEGELRKVINEEAKNSNFKNFSVEEITSTMAARNHTRILSLQPFHERGDLYFPGENINKVENNIEQLIHQMTSFTIDGSKSPHDDLLVSLSFHVEFIRQGGSIIEEKFPKTSAAWFEEQQYQSLMKRNRFLPMSRRKQFNKVFS
jgi:predicted phage terminase large subunit-like protein